MQLAAQIQQHIEQLPDQLQAEVFEYVLALEKKHLKKTQVTEEDALAIHGQLMDKYAEAFENLS